MLGDLTSRGMEYKAISVIWVYSILRMCLRSRRCLEDVGTYPACGDLDSTSIKNTYNI
jgi:hypothetical protein